MTVYMRTGEDSAVGMPLSIYVLAVLPVQLLWLGTKLLVVIFAALSVGGFVAGRWIANGLQTRALEWRATRRHGDLL